MNLFNEFMLYRNTGKAFFGGKVQIDERKKPKVVKEHTRGRVVWSGGTLNLRATQNTIIRGKAAKKAARKLTHQKGYYLAQRSNQCTQ